ncbi:MAG: hypothetical protein C4551_06125 [Bacillota bacterium]|nr:MAG: hypothetical protein C4551_06125 [Bacillota bacterium]
MFSWNLPLGSFLPTVYLSADDRSSPRILRAVPGAGAVPLGPARGRPSETAGRGGTLGTLPEKPYIRC